MSNSVNEFLENMEKEEKEFYAKMEKEENDAIIKLGKCFALRMKLCKRSEEGLEDLFFTVENIMTAMEQIKYSMLIHSPGAPEHAVQFNFSNDRLFHLVSAIFETRGNKFKMNIKIS